MIKSLIIGTVILIMTWLVLRSNVAELKNLLIRHLSHWL